MELRPAHTAPIGEVNVIGIEAVSNHPVPVGHIKKLQKASARNTEHDDDGPLPGQLLAQRLFTDDFRDAQALVPANVNDLAAAGAETAPEIIRRMVVFDGGHDLLGPLREGGNLAVKGQE